MPDYEALLGKPVQAIDSTGHPVRGILRRFDGFSSGMMLSPFYGLGGSWQDWPSICELAFDELTRDELLEWHGSDPFGFLMAGFAWAHNNQGA